MKRKGWVIPILVFIISFSALFFYQKSQTTVTLANTTELPPVLWTKSPSEINEITYSFGNKTITATTTTGGNLWVLPAYNNKQADDLYICDILDKFCEPIFNQVVEVSPSDLTQYGIDKTSPTLTLKDTDGNAYTLSKGNTIDETSDYVYAPLSDTVYSMDSSIFINLKTSEVEWLNKKLLNFSLNQVKKISFSYKNLQAVLEPSHSADGKLIFISNNLNDSLSAEFVHFLESSKIEQFIADGATEHVLNVYGFNSPTLECTIELDNGNSITLTIGNINESENICYAMVNHNNSIVSIPFFDFSQFSAMYAALHESNSTVLG